MRVKEVQKGKPIGWELVEGRELFSFVRGVTFKKSEAISNPNDNTIGVIRAGNIQGGALISNDMIYVPKECVSAEQLILRDDIIIAMSSGSKSIVGKAGIVEMDMQKTSFGAFCGLIRPQSKIVAGWLRLIFISEGYRSIVSSLSSGININNLRPDHLLNLLIPLPPPNEIERIVTRADQLRTHARQAREGLETIPDLLEQLRQSILAAAFRGDLTKEWRGKHPDVEPASELLKRILAERRKRWEEAERDKLKAKGLSGDKLNEEFAKRRKQYKEPAPIDTSALPELPQGWCVTSIDAVAFVTKLAGFEYTKFVTYDPDGDLSVIKAENAGKYGFKKTEFSKIRSETIDHLTRSNLRSGDLLMVFVGAGVGQVAMVPDDQKYFLGPNIGMIRIQSRYVIPEFAELFLRSQIGFSLTMSFTKAVAQPSLSMGAIRLIPLFIPPLEEQKIIVEKLKKYNDIIKESEEKTALFFKSVQILDQSILTKAFRGELVPQDPNDEPAAILLERIRQEKAREAAQPKSKDKRKAKNHVHAEF